MLRSAIANAQQKDGFGGDVERLFVNACYANQGPSQKRIRPAPMGRAFRVVKRTAHLTVQVDRAAVEQVSVGDAGGAEASAWREAEAPKPAAQATKQAGGAARRRRRTRDARQ